MNFDSYTSSVVLMSAELVNLLTPGESAGRAYTPPAGEEAGTSLATAFSRDWWAGRIRFSAEEAAAFAEVAARLRAVFAAIGADDLDLAAETLNDLMAAWKSQPMLSRHNDEPWHLHFHRRGAPEVEAWASGMATGLAMVVGSEYADRLGVCSAPACDRVYVDTSRNGTKRFCSTTCQNRVKAAAFRARKSTT